VHEGRTTARGPDNGAHAIRPIQAARLFTRFGAAKRAGDVRGVRTLQREEWLLIAETDNIKASLVRHLQESRTALREQEPTGFVFEVCPPHARQMRRNTLTEEYDPMFGSFAD
jgi:hypothetical protein